MQPRHHINTPSSPAPDAGGMTVNGLLMQLQADIAGRRVVRPVVSETTALGAAYAAGLAVGFWRDTAELKAQWRVGQTWTPAASAEAVALSQARWNAAVKKCMGWTTVGEGAAAAAAAASALASHHESEHGAGAGAGDGDAAATAEGVTSAPSGLTAEGAVVPSSRSHSAAAHAHPKPSVAASLYSFFCASGPAAERARRSAFATMVSVATGVVIGMAIERAAGRQGWWGDRSGGGGGSGGGSRVGEGGVAALRMP